MFHVEWSNGIKSRDDYIFYFLQESNGILKVLWLEKIRQTLIQMIFRTVNVCTYGSNRLMFHKNFNCSINRRIRWRICIHLFVLFSSLFILFTFKSFNSKLIFLLSVALGIFEFSLMFEFIKVFVAESLKCSSILLF